MTDLFHIDQPEWLDPHELDYPGQNSPPQWHAALVAIIKLRGKGHSRSIYQHGYTDALLDVHDIIARELGRNND